VPCVSPDVCLARIESREIGRYLDGFVWSPCFGMGVIHDIFHSLGSLPSEIDMLNILVTASVILRGVFWSMIAEISLSPLNLVVSSECRIEVIYFFRTQNAITGIVWIN